MTGISLWLVPDPAGGESRTTFHRAKPDVGFSIDPQRPDRRLALHDIAFAA